MIATLTLNGFDPFHATVLFQYPPENIRKTFFLYFQGVYEETSGMIWVNLIDCVIL